MKPFLLALAFLLIVASPSRAQPGPVKQWVRQSSGAPTSCPPGTVTIDTTTGNTYTLKTGTGCKLSGTVSSAAIASIQSGAYQFCTDAVGTDSYACSLSPAITSYTTGMVIVFKAGAANVGAATINLNALGAKTIKKVSGGITTDLADNDIRLGQVVICSYDGTNMQMQSTLGNASELTNSAGANVVPKSNGTNLVASDASNPSGGLIQIGDSGQTGSLKLQSSSGDNNNSVTLKVSTAEDVNTDTTFQFPHDQGLANSVLVNTGSGVTVWGNGFDASNIVALTAGSGAIGSAAKPFQSVFVGSAANNSANITGTFAANRTVQIPDANGTVQLVGAANTGTILPVDMSNGVLSAATGTVYASPGTTAGLTNATESAVSFPVPRAGTIRNLYVRTGGTAKVNTPTTIITVRLNGVDTALTLTMTQTVTTTTSDTTHSFAVVAGDLITVSFVTTGAAGVSTSIAGVSFEVD